VAAFPFPGRAKRRRRRRRGYRRASGAFRKQIDIQPFVEIENSKSARKEL